MKGGDELLLPCIAVRPLRALGWVQGYMRYGVHEEVFLRVGIFIEVKPASGWVSLVEGDEMLLAVALRCDGVELE